MTALNPAQILDALSLDWWSDDQADIGAPIFQTATIYWQDLISKWHSFTATGPCTTNPDGTLDSERRTQYVKDILMAETVRQVGNTGCSGGITNMEPKGFNSGHPIYFK